MQGEVLGEILVPVLKRDVGLHARHMAVLEQVEPRGDADLRLQTLDDLEQLRLHGGDLAVAILGGNQQEVDALPDHRRAALLDA